MSTVLINGKQYEEADLDCPDCGAKMRLRPSKYGLFYGCSSWPDCECTHGAHKESGQPLGTPANRATREARMAAHDAFDQLWQGGPINLTRRDAYAWLRGKMGLPEEETHIARFTAEQCAQVIEAVRQEFEEHGYYFIPIKERIEKQEGFAEALAEFKAAREGRRPHGAREGSEEERRYVAAKERMRELLSGPRFEEV